MAINSGKDPTCKSKPGQHVVVCGTPEEFCQARRGLLNNGLKAKGIRVHPNHEAAFNCYKNYLLKNGYTQMDSRAFAAPNNGPIQVLTKKSRFGTELRQGKTGGGSRFMPMGLKCGIITG